MSPNRNAAAPAAVASTVPTITHEGLGASVGSLPQAASPAAEVAATRPITALDAAAAVASFNIVELPAATPPASVDLSIQLQQQQQPHQEAEKKDRDPWVMAVMGTDEDEMERAVASELVMEGAVRSLRDSVSGVKVIEAAENDSAVAHGSVYDQGLASATSIPTVCPLVYGLFCITRTISLPCALTFATGRHPLFGAGLGCIIPSSRGVPPIR